MRLICGGRSLDNENTLEEAGVEDLSTIELVLSLNGGKKKKKRKQPTTAKKNKHRHKNVSLRTLVYYSLNDGAVVRNRRYCPNDICGPGIRLARHKDRYHCGKCGKTLRVDAE
jgi:small subunit ribosomal protein S27Ae